MFVMINALYHFLVEHDEITTDPFGQKVKFKFASKTEIDDALNPILLLDTRKLLNKFLINYYNKKLIIFRKC